MSMSDISDISVPSLPAHASTVLSVLHLHLLVLVPNFVTLSAIFARIRESLLRPYVLPYSPSLPKFSLRYHVDTNYAYLLRMKKSKFEV